jgi:hypothetical protein
VNVNEPLKKKMYSGYASHKKPAAISKVESLNSDGSRKHFTKNN